MSESLSHISLHVNDTKDKAYFSLHQPYDDPHILEQDIHALLAEEQIVGGILEEVIQEIVHKNIELSHVLIAHNIQPIHGSDACVNFHFDQDHTISPKQLENGSVNYKDLGFLIIVKANDILMDIIPASTGTDGITLYGDLLRAKPGNDSKIKPYKNCHYNEDHSQIIADIDGVLTYDNNRITIEEKVDINHDIGIATGNIHFNGALHIHGNINSHMVVHCKALKVDGIIEGAEIVVDGDLEVEKGIEGHNQGSIQCGGDLTTRFIENATIEVKGHLKADAIVNAYVMCHRTVKLEGKKGQFVGGTLISKGKVRAKTLGSNLGVHTEIYLGEVTLLKRQMHQLEVEIHSLKDNYEKTLNLLSVLDAKLKQAPENEKLTALKPKYTRNKFVVLKAINEKTQLVLKLHNQMIESSIIELHADLIHVDTHVYVSENKWQAFDDISNCLIRGVHGELFVTEHKLVS